MKKLIQMCVAGAIMLCASACGNLTGGDGNVDYIGFKETTNGAWGILDIKTGKPIYMDEFRNKPSLVNDGVFWVEEGGESSRDKKYSLYKVEGKSPKCIAYGLLGAGYFSEGLIPTVSPDSRITLLNKKGEVEFTLDPYNGKEITSSNLRYSSGLLPVECDGQWGAVNTKGEMVIKPEYQYIGDFSSDRALALKQIEGDENTPSSWKYCIIDTKGKVIKSFDCDRDSGFPKIYDGVWLLQNRDDQRFVEMKTGKVLCKVNNDEDIWSFNSKYYVSKVDGQMRVSNYEKERIVRGDYSDIVLFNDEMFYAQKSKDKGYWLNLEGERIGTLDDWNYMFKHPSANIRIVNVDGNPVLLNEKGEIISDEYHTISYSLWTDNDYTLMSDYFNADEALAKMLEPLDLKNGTCNDLTFGMKASEVAAKYSNSMYRTYEESFRLSDNVKVYFDGYYKRPRYVTKVRDGYWGPVTYEEQDGYEWGDVSVSAFEVYHDESSNKSYRLKTMYAKFCEDIQNQGFSQTSSDGEYTKWFENDKYKIHAYLDRMEGGYAFPDINVKIYPKQ